MEDDLELCDEAGKRDRRGHRIGRSEQRRALIAAYESSGLTQKALARREGINYHTFVSWLGQERRAGQSVPGGNAFTEVCVSGSAVGPLEAVLPGGVVVRGREPAQVAQLVRLLGGI